MPDSPSCPTCHHPLDLVDDEDDLSDSSLHLVVCPSCLELSVLEVEDGVLRARDLSEEEAEIDAEWLEMLAKMVGPTDGGMRTLPRLPSLDTAR